MTFETLFVELCETLKISKDLTKISSLFSEQENDLNRIKILVEHNIHNFIMLPDISKVLKSEKTANIYREEGNVFFSKKQYKNSLRSYTKCITNSPSECQSIALGYANRSAALFHLKEYLACLNDIDLALKHSYPYNLIFKLLERRGDCYVELSDAANAKLFYTDMLDLLGTSKLSSEEVKIWSERCKKKLKSLSRIKSKTINNNVFENNKKILNINVKQNDNVLSDACCVDVTVERGRGIFSKRAIQPGEIILIEKPYSSILLPQHQYTHCQYCFSLCFTSIPCLSCTGVIFCNEKCRNLAFKSFHNYECDILDYLEALQLDKFAYLSMRTIIINKAINNCFLDLNIKMNYSKNEIMLKNLKILTNNSMSYVTGLEVIDNENLNRNFINSNSSLNQNIETLESSSFTLKSDINESTNLKYDQQQNFESIQSENNYILDTNIDKTEMTPIISQNRHLQDNFDQEKSLQYIDLCKVEIYSSYMDILNLVTNSDSRQVNDLFRRSILVLFLIKILETTSFFKEGTIDKWNVAGNLLSHVQSFPCNAHEISEFQLNLNDIINSQTIELGAGIYYYLSMFNHSCNPSVTRNFYGDVCVMRAIAFIPPNTEIFDNYGLHYAIHSAIKRQTKLQMQYLFKCACEACIDNWPKFHSICGKAPTWKCNKCQLPMPYWNEMDLKLMCKNCKNEENIALKKQNLIKVALNFKNNFELLLSNPNKVQLVEPKICSYLGTLFNLVAQPSEEYCKAQEALKQCYNILGNKVIVDA